MFNSKTIILLLGLVFASPAYAQNINFGGVPYSALALSTTVKTVKAGRGTLQAIHCLSATSNATTAYVQLFDTTGAVTLGTTTPTTSLGIPIAGTTGTQLDVRFPSGMNFTTGLKIAATTTSTGSTALTTGLDCVLVFN